MKNYYVYPAIFKQEDTGIYFVNFPDLTHCYTQGDDLADAVAMAQDVLHGRIEIAFEENEELPKPSELNSLVLDVDETAMLVPVNVESIKRQARFVKKTLSIPHWLNDLAEREHINFSGVLQQALKERLDV